MTLRRIVAEPLLHFFVAGALLFLLFGQMNRGLLEAPDEIVVDEARIEALRAQFQRVWQRPPAADELDGLVEAWIREEVLYREGVALGLGQDDPVIRRRVAQKLDFISDGLVDDTVTEEQLQAWLDDHVEDYRIEPQFALRQAYLDPSRHADPAAATAALARALEAGDFPSAGDSTLLPGVLVDASATDIARIFGRGFAEVLAGLPAGSWQGPVESGYGLHFVHIDRHVPGRAPALDEVRAAVERDLLAARREAAKQAQFEALKARYSIVVPEPLPGSTVAAGER